MATQLLKILLTLLSLCFCLILPITSKNSFRVLDLMLLIKITALLAVTAISANNFALVLLVLEGFSLTLYIMAALARNYGAVTASVKYFSFGTLGSVFLFWGVVHLYSLVPSLSMDDINKILSNAYLQGNLACNSLDFATTAIVFGFMIKLGAAPVHQWVSDTYAGAHMYVTAYFSVFVKCVLFLVFLRIASHFNCDAILTQFTIFSLLMGCFMSINQTEIKRLLAYSSIVHLGFLLMGDTLASLLYLLTYLLSSLVIFSILLRAEIVGKELIYLNDLKFIRDSGPSNVFAMVVALASSAGLPPFAGFYGKFFVWINLVEDIYLTNNISSYLILFISLSITLITIFYYMRVIAYLFVGSDAGTARALPNTYEAHDFYLFLFSIEGLLVTVLILWTIIQTYVIHVLELVVLLL